MGGSVGGGIVRALQAVWTAGLSEVSRSKPFQSGGHQGRLFNDLLSGGTAGIVDFGKGRINVPFSGAQVRAGGRETINALSLGLAQKEGDKFVESPFSKRVTPYVGAAGGLATGAGLAGAAGVGTAAGGGLTTAGQIGATAAVGAASAAAAAQQPKPKLPGVLDTSAIDQAAREAANAVQTADAEGRRARAAKRRSAVLSSYQPGQAVSAATLQPAQPQKSVLG